MEYWEILLMSSWVESGPYTVFDVETTGCSAAHCRIIELGAVRLDTDGSFSRYSTLINPECPVPYQITQLTGISNAMVADAPVFADAAQDIMDFFAGSKLVAHNARFDLSFLMESLARANTAPMWNDGAYDTLALARRAFPGQVNYKLQTLKESLGLGTGVDGNAHRALFDAEITMELFCRCMKILTGQK